VLYHDPSNSEFGLRLKDFGWNLISLCELGRISIPLDSMGLRLLIRMYSISWRRFIFTYDLVAIPWLIWEIVQREGELTFGRSGSGYCSRAWRTVYAGSADRPRGAQQPTVRHVLREFLSCFVSIYLTGRFSLEVVGRTVHPVRPDCPRGEDCPQ
jgi:hypothetical protein